MVKELIHLGVALVTGASLASFGNEEPVVAPPAHKNAAQSAHPSTPVPQSGAYVPKSPDGLFHITAEVNGKPVRFVIDTGANTVVLTAEDARRIGVSSVAGDAGYIKTAGGNSATRWVRLNEIRVAGHDMKSVDAVVVETDLQVSLLGQSALSRLNSVTVQGHRMRLD